jgi:hypothetical protein
MSLSSLSVVSKNKSQPDGTTTTENKTLHLKNKNQEDGKIKKQTKITRHISQSFPETTKKVNGLNVVPKLAKTIKRWSLWVLIRKNKATGMKAVAILFQLIKLIYRLLKYHQKLIKNNKKLNLVALFLRHLVMKSKVNLKIRNGQLNSLKICLRFESSLL